MDFYWHGDKVVNASWRKEGNGFLTCSVDSTCKMFAY